MKSTQFTIGQFVIVDGVQFTKQSEAEQGQNVNPEIWTTDDGTQYEPTLAFQEGVGEVGFNRLTPE